MIPVLGLTCNPKTCKLFSFSFLMSLTMINLSELSLVSFLYVHNKISSFCSGLTQSNYKELNVLYEKYKSQGCPLILVEKNFIDSYVLQHLYGFEVWNKWAEILIAGFEILAFPCNQFAGQEPGSNEEIQEVVCTMFKAEFPIFDKVTLVSSLWACIILRDGGRFSRISFSGWYRLM